MNHDDQAESPLRALADGTTMPMNPARHNRIALALHRSRRIPGRPALRRLATLFALLTALAPTLHAAPIRLHPDNPRWFEWRGRAVALVTSAEHYGAVLNRDFDFHRYLAALEREGLHYTRVFAGSFVEPLYKSRGSDSLAPARGSFLAPWARSNEPGYAGGGNKFDLDRFSPEYLARLKEFITEADRRGIVVELTIFCVTYREHNWELHPFNPTNNIQAIAVPDWKALYTLPAAATQSANPAAVIPLFPVQEKLARWLVRELNGFDNLFYEIQNEPWADNYTMGPIMNPYLQPRPYAWLNAIQMPPPESIAWQRAIGRAITDEESRLPHRHLIAQNVANFRLALRDSDLVPEASILHFHLAFPEAVEWNRGLDRVIGCDETGFAGHEDVTYRQQAWNFVLSGGGLFNHLDWSFTVGSEDGRDTGHQATDAGGPNFRRQIRVLDEFVNRLDLAKTYPDLTLVRRAPGVTVHALSQPGQAHALYAQGRSPTTLTLDLAQGRWTAEWISIEDGQVLKRESIVSRDKPVDLASPEFNDGVALRILRSTAVRGGLSAASSE